MWVVLLVWFATFSFLGAAIARTRGYSAAFGALVGWTGFGTLLLLAYLPDRTAPGKTELMPPSVPEGAERWLRGTWVFVVGALSLAIVIGFLATQWPTIARVLFENEVAQVMGPVVGGAILLAWLVVYGLAIFMLVRDRRLPERGRAPWLVGLVFFNMFAALIFVPWRWFVVRRHGPKPSTA
jgi:hypothetical protein